LRFFVIIERIVYILGENFYSSNFFPEPREINNKMRHRLMENWVFTMARVGTLCLVIGLMGCSTLEFNGQPHSYHPPLPVLGNVKIALVLGGGGAKGLAHVGVLEELTAAGIKPDLIVGCSAGAIIGGLYADNPDLHRLKNLLMDRRREHMLNLSFSHLPFGLTDGDALKVFLEQNIQAKTFEELKIPFMAVATNLEYGDLVMFGKGPLVPAIRASAAFPGVFHPVRLNGTYFVDGGVVNNVPVNVAKRYGAEFIIAVELSTPLVETPPTNLLGVLKRSLEISLSHQSGEASKGADFIIRVPFKGVGTFDDHLNDHIYELGVQSVRQSMDQLKDKIKAVFP
jgi:NTE family protein